MNAFPLRVSLGTAVAVLISVAGAARASAQECSSDAECGAGSVCVTHTSEVCGGMTAPACEPGEDCPPPPDPICEPYSYSYCTAAPCAANSDCPADMVCHAAPNYVCTAYPNAGTGGGAAGGCAADEMCPPQVSECHVEPGVPVCTPRYTLPCSADTDCGAGFSCKEAIGYVCHGGMSAGAGGASAGGTSGAGASGASGDGAGEVAGSGAPGEPWTCTEEPTGEFYCELQELACETDADCPGSLRCQENWAYECPGAGAGGGVAVAGAGGAIGTAGTTAVPPTEPEEPGVGGMGGSGWQCEQVLLSKSCAPDDYFPPPPGGMGGQSGSAGTGGAAGGGTINPPTMNPGTGGNAPGAGAGGAGGTTGGESGPSSGDGDDWLDHPRGRFGCAVAGDDASDALWSSLGLLGFAALILRRRGRTMI